MTIQRQYDTDFLTDQHWTNGFNEQLEGDSFIFNERKFSNSALTKKLICN